MISMESFKIEDNEGCLKFCKVLSVITFSAQVIMAKSFGISIPRPRRLLEFIQSFLEFAMNNPNFSCITASHLLTSLALNTLHKFK